MSIMRAMWSTSSLVALIWASAAMATPLVATRIETRDVAIRADTPCPSGYTSHNGLNFTTYCEQNNPFNDAMDPFLVSSMEECMERCSRYWGDDEGCFGVVWREDQNCWLRNSSTGTANLTPDTGIHAALVQRSQMKAFDTKCPYADLSTHNMNDSYSGIGYTMQCGKDIGPDGDICWDAEPECLPGPFAGYFHATSLDDCLNICMAQHPLCQAVAFNPDLKMGYANYWPKTSFPDKLGPPGGGTRVMHVATITNIETIDSKCPSSDQYTTSGNKQFDIHCGQINQGQNITSLHTRNVTACIDACAASDKSCVGILFDSSLAGGINNCYLQNTTSLVTDKTSITYAVLAGTTLPSSSASTTPLPNSSGSGSSSSSSSKAWIAGPVVGGLVAIAIVAGAFLLWRRKKAAPGEPKGHDYAPAPAGSPGYEHREAPPMYHQTPPSELHAVPTSELGVTPSTKYAHAKSGATGAGQAPQELAA